jgi:hypothetical protein
MYTCWPSILQSTILHITSKMRGYLNMYIKKVKWSRYRPGVTQRVCRGIALLFHDRGTRRGWVVSITPRPHFTPGKDPVPILQEAGWTPGPFWRAENLVPTGIRSRTVQPVVGRYTDLVTRPIILTCIRKEIKVKTTGSQNDHNTIARGASLFHTANHGKHTPVRCSGFLI